LAGHKLRYSVLEGRFAICRLAPDSPAPQWASGVFHSVTRTTNELSVVCAEERVLQLEGRFPFEMTGVLAAILNPLAAAEIGIFAISTFDTDYILIKADRVQAAEESLRRAGHERIA